MSLSSLGLYPLTEDRVMRGYVTSFGYMGLVVDKWMLFSSESEYYEYLRENEI